MNVSLIVQLVGIRKRIEWTIFLEVNMYIKTSEQNLWTLQVGCLGDWGALESQSQKNFEVWHFYTVKNEYFSHFFPFKR